MCDAKKSTSKDDDDIDIYSELPNFKYDENLLKLEGDNKALKSTVAELTKKVETLEIQLKSCEKINSNYRRNISILFLSAKREIERKDKTISELRSRSFTSYQDARRDFPRRDRIEPASRQNPSRSLEGDKEKSKSETPALNEPKKIGYCFTAGNTRSGSYKCQYPATANKTKAYGSSCKSDFKDGIKKIDGSKTLLSKDSEDSCSKLENNSKTVTNIGQKSECNPGSSKNTGVVKNDSKEMNEKKQSATLVGRISPIDQKFIDKGKSIASSFRCKSPIASTSSKSTRTSNERKSSTTSGNRKPVILDRRRSPRTSVRMYMDSGSGKNSRAEHRRSGSKDRRLVRTSSRRILGSSSVGRSRNRDLVGRVVESRKSSPVRENIKLTELSKLEVSGPSGMKPASESKAKELKEIESVISSIEIVTNKVEPYLSRVESENSGETIPIPAPVQQSAEVENTGELLSSEKSTISSENEEIERVKSLPPLIGPWTQFSVRRYKKLHGFSPVKPDTEKKKVVSIKVIEKKNLFSNKIEKIVLTDVEGKTTKDIFNIEVESGSKGPDCDKILESNSECKTSIEILVTESNKSDEKVTESNKILESNPDLDSGDLNNHDSSKEIRCDKILESGILSLHDLSRESLSKEVVSGILDLNKENLSENNNMSVNNSTDNQIPTDLHSGSNIDISSDKTSNSKLEEISVGNLVPGKTSASSSVDDVSGELISEKCADNCESQIFDSAKEDELLKEIVAECGITITDNNTTDSVPGSVTNTVKDIDSCRNESNVDNKFLLSLEMKENCHVNSKSGVKNNQDNTRIGENNIEVDVAIERSQLPLENKLNKGVEDVNEIFDSRSDHDQLKLSKDNEENVEEKKNINIPSVDGPKNTENLVSENVGENNCETFTSGRLQLISEVLESFEEGQDVNKSCNIEKVTDEEINFIAKDQEQVEGTNFKGIVTDSGLNAFEKSDAPDESPTYKSDTFKLNVEKPKIIDNISSSLHTFNSALDFSISTTNTNSLNTDGNIELQRKGTQLSASSLQVVNALKKLPKIRENFLQLFGESSIQDNPKDSELETPTEEIKETKAVFSATSNKELKSLSCSSSLSSSSSTSSSSSSSASSLITQDKSSECTIPPVIRLFGINITEEHSPFHVCKSSSQNSVVEDAISHPAVQDNESCLKTTTANNSALENKSDISKSESVEVIRKVDAILENKTTEINCPLVQITTELKTTSETKVVNSSLTQEQHTEKMVISKEIICEEPVVFPVPIIVADKDTGDKLSNKSVSSQIKENKITGEYYSNFAEALRNETNVSVSKTKSPQPEFQFESPSRYIMRINNNSVTSHKCLESAESQSVTGEDTLTMVRRLAKTYDTVSPIKTPSKRSESRKSFVSIESVVGGDLVESDNREQSIKKQTESEKVIEGEKKLIDDDTTKKIDQAVSLAKNETQKGLDFKDKNDKVSVSLSSEHFEFKRRRSSRPIVRLKNTNDSCSTSKQNELISNKILNNQQNESSNTISTPCIHTVSSNSKNNVSPNNVVKTSKRSSPSSKQDPIQDKRSPLSSRNDSSHRKRCLSSPRDEPIQDKMHHLPLRNDFIQGKHCISSPVIAPIQRKRGPSPSSSTIQGVQRFKRRRVVINRSARDDVIKLRPSNEKLKVESNAKNREQSSTDYEKNREPIASTSAIRRHQNLSVSAHLGSSVKRMNDEKESGLGKQLKVDKSVSEEKCDDSKASAKGVETKTSSNFRQRNQGRVDAGSDVTDAKPYPKVVDNVRSSKRSGVIDLKTDFCERRSPSEYFNRSMNRRYRGLLRDRKLQRCRSPFVSRRRVDKYLMKMRETRERSETRSSRVAVRSVNNEVNKNCRLSTDYCIEWRLKPIDFHQQIKETLFERLVAENVLEKLEKRRTFVIDNPVESTPPPSVCQNDNRVLVDQSNRSNQIILNPESSHHPSLSNHSDTPKLTPNIPETSKLEISSPKKVPQSNKIVIFRRRSNNSPKVLGDSVGTFVKTNSTQISSSPDEEKNSRAIIIRRERGKAPPGKLEDSPRCQVFDQSAKLSVEKASTSNPCNENQGNGSKKELVKNCDTNSREIVSSSIRSTRIVKTQLDFRSRLRRNRK